MPASLPQRRINPMKEQEIIEDLNPVQEEVVVEEKPKVRKVVKSAEVERIKYTATMDSQLRKKLRLAAVNAELDISEFIEIAVREKLEREGY